LTLNVSTGKRISQKLLRNCVKFLSIIHDVLKIAPMEYIKQSSDEVDIRGPESKYDSRKINSYPSKVRGGGLFSPQYTYFEITCAGQSQYMCLHASPHNTESADFHRMYWQNTLKYMFGERAILCIFSPACLSKIAYYASEINFQQFGGVMCVGPRMRVNQPQRCAKN